jgi:hypothetical protein
MSGTTTKARGVPASYFNALVEESRRNLRRIGSGRRETCFPKPCENGRPELRYAYTDV